MKPTLTSGHLRRAVGTLLADTGIAEPQVEADRIVGHALGVSRASLHAHPERIVPGDVFSQIIEFSIRRATHEPLAYIFGSALFCGLTLEVNRHTLIPRPETEILCDIAQDYIEKRLPSAGVLADWCTGSGALAIALLSKNPSWRGYAVDASREALAVAERNAAANGVKSHLRLIRCADPAEANDIIPRESLDLIVANPPYIPTKELASLETQVCGFEPSLALDGGPDGLDIYRLLIRTLPSRMKPGAPLFFETAGGGQAAKIAALAQKSETFLAHERNLCDHRGIERFMLWHKCGRNVKIT